MLFRVERTSNRHDKPCKGAKPYIYPNHRHMWAIEIKTLDEFIIFIKKNGPLIIEDDTIEIYDDWRE